MPKERRDRSLSSNSCRASPYPCSSSCEKHSSPHPVEDLKEWEEVRCSVCMEHPHNAVLLLCSSHEKGCRPYMCDTSYRHSNCLDQFRKTSAEFPTTTLPSNASFYSSTETLEALPATSPERSEAESPPGHYLACESNSQQKLMCPLCRGTINGWIIEEPARRFMDAKSRSCACETCDFSGSYAELRKHARHDHPLVRPSKADPERERDWRRMERERDIGDVLSTIQSAFGEERGGVEDNLFLSRVPSLSVLIFFRISRVPLSESGGSNSSPGRPRYRGQARSRRRTTLATLWGEDLDTETNSDVRDVEDGSSEGVPSLQPHRQNRRHRMPDDER